MTFALLGSEPETTLTQDFYIPFEEQCHGGPHETDEI
jgi:hypothetical protein